MFILYTILVRWSGTECDKIAIKSDLENLLLWTKWRRYLYHEIWKFNKKTTNNKIFGDFLLNLKFQKNSMINLPSPNLTCLFSKIIITWFNFLIGLLKIMFSKFSAIIGLLFFRKNYFVIVLLNVFSKINFELAGWTGAFSEKRLNIFMKL